MSRPLRTLRLPCAAALTAALLGACGGVPDRTEPVRLTIPQGASFQQVTDSLAARDVISNPLWFRVLGRIKGVDRKIGAGIYEFAPGATAEEVLQQLAEHRVAAQRFTVPEGRTLFEVAELADVLLWRLPYQVTDGRFLLRFR